jgi:hypothetical protein
MWGGAVGARRVVGGLWETAFSTQDADRQLVMAINLNLEPEPGAATAAVENMLRREIAC